MKVGIFDVVAACLMPISLVLSTSAYCPARFAEV